MVVVVVVVREAMVVVVQAVVEGEGKKWRQASSDCTRVFHSAMDVLLEPIIRPGLNAMKNTLTPRRLVR